MNFYGILQLSVRYISKKQNFSFALMTMWCKSDTIRHTDTVSHNYTHNQTQLDTLIIDFKFHTLS